MPVSLVTASYLGATILFILSLGGLSQSGNRQARQLVRHRRHGDRRARHRVRLPRADGGRSADRNRQRLRLHRRRDGRRRRASGLAARTVKMTQMPELVAIMHSLVGFAACTIGFASYIDTSTVFPTARRARDPRARNLHRRADRRGDLHRLGHRLSASSSAQDQRQAGAAAGRHGLNLAGLLIVICFGYWFLSAGTDGAGMLPLIVMTLIALAFGVHMVMAIGGADMPVVISMLNSYSGWAAAAHRLHAVERPA